MSRYTPNLKLGDRMSPGKSSWTTANPQPHSKKWMCWIGHKVCSGFPIASYSKTWTDCLANRTINHWNLGTAKQYYHNKNLTYTTNLIHLPPHTHFHCCLLNSQTQAEAESKKPMDVVHKYALEEQTENSLGGQPAIQGKVKTRFQAERLI